MNSNRKVIITLMTWFLILTPVTLFVSGDSSADDISGSERIRALEAQLKEDPQNMRLRMELGIIYHGKAADGDKQAIGKAEQLFKEILDVEPGNAEARAWYGSLLTIKGREDWFPFAKLFYVNQGVQEMDRAVELAPDNVFVRLVRAHTSLALPYAFGRTKVAIKDFEYLLTLSKDKPGQFDASTLAQIHLGLGKAYAKSGDKNKARENWQKVMELVPDSREALEARSLLEG